jgi:signal transduction histidine kinase
VKDEGGRMKDESNDGCRAGTARLFHAFNAPWRGRGTMTNTVPRVDERDLREDDRQPLEGDRPQAGDQQQESGKLHVLAQVMAHDLRRPLQSVANSCRSLLERYPDSLDPKTTSLVEDALEAVANMEYLLADLLGGVEPGAKKCLQPRSGN